MKLPFFLKHKHKINKIKNMGVPSYLKKINFIMMKKSCKTKAVPKTFKDFIRSWYFWKLLLGVTVGGLLGFLYYYFVGCKSGSCAITSNPYMSIIWGSLLGLFLFNSPCTSGKC